MALINGLATSIPGSGPSGMTEAAANLPQARIPAAENDVEMFNAAMTGPVTATSEAASAANITSVTEIVPNALGDQVTTKVTSIGDHILGGLEKMRADMSGQENNILNTLHTSSSSGAMEVQDMIELQMQVTGWAIQQELVSKVVSKSTQTVDQLMKAQ